MHRYLTLSEPLVRAHAFHDALRRIVARAPSLDSDRAADTWVRLACGDFDSVRALIRTAPPSPALPFAVASHTAWTGDLHTALALWQNVAVATERLLNAADDDDAIIRDATCCLLARTAADVADHALAARLRAALRSRGIDPDDDAVHPLLPRAGDPDVHVVADTLDRLLGPRPDAVRGRLRLRPALATGETTATGIPCGDARLTWNARHGAGLTVLRVSQEAGAVPITLVLEPLLPGALRRAEVDGAPATLSPRTVEGGTLVPVQLVLDQPRTCALEWEHNEKEPPRRSGSQKT